MARHYKKWEDHSPRWQREASKEGLTSKRWNGWQKLSEKTRKQTDPRQYAAGKTVAAQLREGKEKRAVAKIAASANRTARQSVIVRNVKRMSDSDLNWTLKASPTAIRKRASNKNVPGYARNPWWYM